MSILTTLNGQARRGLLVRRAYVADAPHTMTEYDVLESVTAKAADDSRVDVDQIKDHYDVEHRVVNMGMGHIMHVIVFTPAAANKPTDVA